MAQNDSHSERIKQELKKAGITNYGLIKAEARHLPSLIHKDEHIGGVVYGRSLPGSAMIVATDKRMLYLDHRLLFSKNDEFTYDVVSGVSINEQNSYAGVTLHTRLGDFKLLFVNLTCARRFVKYVESRQIETTDGQKADVTMPTFAIEDGRGPVEFSQKARTFLITHELATLSTLSEEGAVHGAVVYYATDKNNYIYIVTKSQTQKAKNLQAYPQAALTIFDTSSMQTLQIEGVAHVESDPQITKNIYENILRPRFSSNHTEMPPIMYLPAGEYEVITLRTKHYKFSDYKTQK